MRFIRPILIDDTTFVSSTVAEPGTAWASGTPYAADAIVLHDHHTWRSMQGTNTGHEPGAAGSGEWWEDQGVTNRWAMFDQVVGTATTATGEMTVVLNPGIVDSIALLDIDAEGATIEMTVGGTLVYSRTLSTFASGGAITNWYDWYFAPRGRTTTLIFGDLPAYSAGEITITVNGVTSGSAISVGTLIVGRRFEIGDIEASPTVGLNDYSLKDADAFGNVTVVERAWSKRMECRCLLPTSRAGAVQVELAKVRAKPVLWIGADGFDPTVIYGFFKSFSIDLALPTVSYCSLTIEGLI